MIAFLKDSSLLRYTS